VANIALIGVDLSVEVAHIGSGEFVVEIGEGVAELGGIFSKGVMANDGGRPS